VLFYQSLKTLNCLSHEEQVQPRFEPASSEVTEMVLMAISSISFKVVILATPLIPDIPVVQKSLRNKSRPMNDMMSARC
jgi:hypothetical protein